MRKKHVGIAQLISAETMYNAIQILKKQENKNISISDLKNITSHYIAADLVRNALLTKKAPFTYIDHDRAGVPCKAFKTVDAITCMEDMLINVAKKLKTYGITDARRHLSKEALIATKSALERYNGDNLSTQDLVKIGMFKSDEDVYNAKSNNSFPVQPYYDPTFKKRLLYKKSDLLAFIDDALSQVGILGHSLISKEQRKPQKTITNQPAKQEKQMYNEHDTTDIIADALSEIRDAKQTAQKRKNDLKIFERFEEEFSKAEILIAYQMDINDKGWIAWRMVNNKFQLIIGHHSFPGKWKLFSDVHQTILEAYLPYMNTFIIQFKEHVKKMLLA